MMCESHHDHAVRFNQVDEVEREATQEKAPGSFRMWCSECRSCRDEFEGVLDFSEVLLSESGSLGFVVGDCLEELEAGRGQIPDPH